MVPILVHKLQQVAYELRPKPEWQFNSSDRGNELSGDATDVEVRRVKGYEGVIFYLVLGLYR